MRIVRKWLLKLGLDVRMTKPEGRVALNWLKALNVTTVLDVGANTGQFAAFARAQFPRAQIYSFEPLNSCFQALVENMAGDSSFRAFKIALGDSKGQARLSRHHFTPTSSFLQPSELLQRDWPAATPEGVELVEVRRLDDVVLELTLVDNVLLKLDVQGFEDKVLAGAAHTLSKCKVVITEVSFEQRYHRQPLFGDIYRILVGAGFLYKGNLEQQLSRVDGRVVEADAVFLREG